jgi:hypothetical protein
VPDRHTHDSAGRLPHAQVPGADVSGGHEHGRAVRMHAQDGALRPGLCHGVSGGLFDEDSHC